MSDLAPIVLFVYNRIEHTRQTITALQANFLANQSHLIIYHDAPKTPDDNKNTHEVSSYIKTIRGFKSVIIIERSENYGLARSITEGVTDVINKYGKVIVLEDDMITSELFLRFMNQALDYYADSPRVMSINAYVPPAIEPSANLVFFTRAPSPWGWATWANRWSLYRKDVDAVLKGFDIKQKHEFDFDSTYPYIRAIVRNKKGQLNTWAVFWYATVFRNNGLCISPPFSLVSNIGNDGSGVNCRETEHYNVQVFKKDAINFSNDILESKEIFNALKAFNKTLHPGFFSKAYMIMLNIFRSLMIKIT